MRGPAIVEVRFVTQDVIDQECGKAPGDLQTKACTKLDLLGRPYITMPLPAPYADKGEYFAQLMAHETAHAAFGWPANHPL